jgi:hypothetical protein
MDERHGSHCEAAAPPSIPASPFGESAVTGRPVLRIALPTIFCLSLQPGTRLIEHLAGQCWVVARARQDNRADQLPIAERRF